jgi:MFS family permease
MTSEQRNQVSTDHSAPAHTSLWNHTDFLLLWSGQTLSMFGSTITYLALPLTAVITLDVSALQMGMLAAAQGTPVLLVSLWAGVMADRSERRKMLIGSDLARMILLGSLPLALVLGVLSFPQLLVVAFLVGGLTVIFDTAYQSFLPSVVSREELLEANAKLAGSHSVAEVTGPGLGGLLIGLATPPGAILLDALSFGASALSLGRIRPRERSARAAGRARAMALTEIREGLGTVFGSSILGPITIAGAVVALFASMQEAILVLYANRELGVSAALLGMIYTLSGLFGLAGAVLVKRLSKLVGVGPILVAAQLLKAAGAFAFAIVTGPKLVVVLLLLLGEGLFSLGIALFNVNAVSLRQSIVPDHIQGRVAGSMRFFMLGFVPLGALMGGAIGTVLGLRQALLLGAVGVLGGAVYLGLSSVRSVRGLGREHLNAMPA